MSSNVDFHRPDFSGEPDSNDFAAAEIGPASPESPTAGKNISRDNPESPTAGKDTIHNEPPRTEAESNGHRHESVATAVEDHSPDANMDKIETIPTQDKKNSSGDDNDLGLKETVKQKAHSAKKKLYLHDRNKRKLSKQFTAGSALDHIPYTERERENATPAELEAQIELQGRSVPVWHNIKIMLTTFPYWNMAFWSGWCYSIGSALFIISSCFSWVPLTWEEDENLETYGGPLCFFFGACLYQIGGVMAYLEAVNDGSFAGAAMKRLLEGHQDIEKELLDAKLHTFFGHIIPHHHRDDDEKKNSTAEPENNWESLTKKDTNPEEVYEEAKERVERRGGMDMGPTEETKEGDVREYLTWKWYPSWNSFIHYHIRELGYVACTVQLFGVTLYGVTSVVILPGILSSLVWWQKLWAYWIPQIVASCCFIIASVMFIIMAQDKWNVPKPRAVSWWIGVHALIGSVGFLLIACFGVHSNKHTWAEYQSDLSSIWGSFFYMVSGLFQWYEAINDNVGPVLAFPNNRTPVLLRAKGKKIND